MEYKTFLKEKPYLKINDNPIAIIADLEPVDRETINNKIASLVDLLQIIITNVINKSSLNSEIKDSNNSEINSDLMYYSDEDSVYIHGKKTYENKDLIKKTFKGSSWCKDKSAWTFKKFENYEKILNEAFPNIIKDQV